MKSKMQKRRLMYTRGAALLILLVLLLAPAGIVHAHPVDMYSQNFFVTLTTDGVQVDWRILPGPLIADAVWQAADQNHDGAISDAEANAWVAAFFSKLTITLDGQTVNVAPPQHVHWPQTVDALRTGEDSVETAFDITWPTQDSGKHSLAIHNAHLEGNSLNWFSVNGQNDFIFDRPVQNNGQLNFDFYFRDNSATTIPSALTTWNSGIPNLPGFTSSLASVAEGLANPNPSSQPASGQTSVAQTLTGLVKTQQFTPLFLLGAFLLSLALGSLHALTPGHGKALVGAYLVGSQGRTRDAVFLGLIVTATHTGSVLLLGLITLFASHYILPSLIVPWLDLISGLLVIGFGVNLLLQRRRDFTLVRFPAFNGRKFAIQSAAPARGMDLLQPYDRSHEHAHEHSHSHSHELAGNRVTWRSLLTLGVSGGLVPCPDAIAILLVAVAVNRIPFGMLLIVAFSIGLALVLIGIGIAMVKGVELAARNDALTRFGIYAPMVSALVVTGLGVALTISAGNAFKFSSLVSAPAANQVQTLPAFDIRRAQLYYLAANGQNQIQLFRVALGGGDPVQVTNGAAGVLGYTFSPDKSQILYTGFSASGGSAMWIMNKDGAGNHLVLDCGKAECFDPEWYPDGEKIAYDHLDSAQDAALSVFSVWWLDLKTGKTNPVFQDQKFPSFSPRFSPNGQWLSYLSPATNTLQFYDLQSGRSMSLPVRQSSMRQMWSPKGDAIIFWDPPSAQSASVLHAKVYRLASGQTVDLGGSANESDDAAAWSPDGASIALVRFIPGQDTSAATNQILLAKPDGSAPRVLLEETNASFADLSWSPDGKYLIFTRYAFQSGGQSEIWWMDVQSGEKKAIAENGMLPLVLP